MFLSWMNKNFALPSMSTIWGLLGFNNDAKECWVSLNLFIKYVRWLSIEGCCIRLKIEFCEETLTAYQGCKRGIWKLTIGLKLKRRVFLIKLNSQTFRGHKVIKNTMTPWSGGALNRIKSFVLWATVENKKYMRMCVIKKQKFY